MDRRERRPEQRVAPVRLVLTVHLRLVLRRAHQLTVEPDRCDGQASVRDVPEWIHREGAAMRPALQHRHRDPRPGFPLAHVMHDQDAGFVPDRRVQAASRHDRRPERRGAARHVRRRHEGTGPRCMRPGGVAGWHVPLQAVPSPHSYNVGLRTRTGTPTDASAASASSTIRSLFQPRRLALRTRGGRWPSPEPQAYGRPNRGRFSVAR
jgi:hypothetical protein